MKHARADYNRIQDPDGKIPEDEPVFLIRAQDVVGHRVVRVWANQAEAEGASPTMVKLVRDFAIEMENWPVKKVPDL